MAGLWQRTGTVTVTNGSKKVTGFGSQWKSTVYKPDKGHAFYGPDGKAYEIDYVESDTVLYLVLAYAGATIATQPYAIDITRTATVPAFSRELSAQLAYAQSQYDSWQQILTGVDMVALTAPDGQQVQVPSLLALQPKHATLTAMAGVATAADKVILFTGQDTATAMTVTEFGRSLIDDADATAARNTLQTPGLFFAGDPTGMDCNTLVSPGVHRLGPSPLNAPPGAQYSQLEVDIGGADTLTQKIANFLTGELWVRTGIQVSGAWQFNNDWRKQFDTKNIVGTVAQSAGMPTGAIIERGSNANGDYVKFADGSMFCVKQIDFIGPATVSSEAYIISYWPAIFAHASCVEVTALQQIGSGSQANVGINNYNGMLTSFTTTYVRLASYAYRLAQSQPGEPVRYSVMGYGNWF